MAAKKTVSQKVYEWLQENVCNQSRPTFVMKDIQKAVRAGNGAISGTLHRLAEEGMISAKQDPNAPRRAYLYRVKDVKAIRDVASTGILRKANYSGGVKGRQDKGARLFLVRGDRVSPPRQPVNEEKGSRTLVDRVASLEKEVTSMKDIILQLKEAVGV